MKVTRIARSHDLNKGKYAELEEQAERLGRVRTETWQRFGSLAGVGLRDRTLRDKWLKEGREFGVLANPWKETLRDTIGDIKAHREAAKVKVRRSVRRHTSDQAERKRLFTALKADQWTEDAYLRRMMRKHWRRGHNHTSHQIIVRSDNYTTFELGGRIWIKIPGLERGKQIPIPLNTTVAPTGTLRLILRDGVVEVHYAIDAEEKTDGGDKTIGVDKGFTEVLVDSDGERHGEGLGNLLANESDRLKLKYRRRSKLRAISKKKPHKKEPIERFNLGGKKRDRRSQKHQSKVRNIVFKAVHAVVDKAGTIAAEDLTSPMAGKTFGKNVNRRLASWTKGAIAEALDHVSRRRGSSLVLVNAAYTSQTDSRNGCLSGQRNGDRFYCEDGEVLPADENAARNVLARLHDPGIDRWTPYKQVKSILLERTSRHRLGLLNQDSSCNPRGLSTESEVPNDQL